MAGTASADVYRTKVKGSGVIGTFYADDGCVVTTGELGAVTTVDGTFAIVSANRIDYCAEGGPVRWDYLSGGELALTSNGTTSATLDGSVVMTPYQGPSGGDVTLDVALSFTGTGAVSTTTSNFASGGNGVTLNFSSQRQRAADVSGSLTVDGVDASVSAQLVSTTQGEVVVVQ